MTFKHIEGRCGICGEPMPLGEEMFKYHGYSGPCPKPAPEKEFVHDEDCCCSGDTVEHSKDCKNCECQAVEPAPEAQGQPVPMVKRATGRTIPDLTGREHVCEWQANMRAVEPRSEGTAQPRRCSALREAIAQKDAEIDAEIASLQEQLAVAKKDATIADLDIEYYRTGGNQWAEMCQAKDAEIARLREAVKTVPISEQLADALKSTITNLRCPKEHLFPTSKGTPAMKPSKELVAMAQEHMKNKWDVPAHISEAAANELAEFGERVARSIANKLKQEAVRIAESEKPIGLNTAVTNAEHFAVLGACGQLLIQADAILARFGLAEEDQQEGIKK